MYQRRKNKKNGKVPNMLKTAKKIKIITRFQKCTKNQKIQLEKNKEFKKKNFKKYEKGPNM